MRTKINPKQSLTMPQETKLSETLRLLDQVELALSHAIARKEIPQVAGMACMEKLEQVTKCIQQEINLLKQKAK